MIYRISKNLMMWTLGVPDSPPPAPPGEPESVEIFRASPRFLIRRLLLHFGSALSIIGFEAFAWLLSPDSTWLSRRISIAVMLLTIIAATLRYLVIRLEYDLRYYMLTNQCLRIRRGAMVIEESTYTLANVQTVALQQGPIDRLFGICNLHIETAGGGSNETAHEAQARMFHRGKLEGINARQARVLRDRILTRITQFRDSGLGDKHVGPDAAGTAHSRGMFELLSPGALLILQEIGVQLKLVNESLQRRRTSVTVVDPTE